LADAVGVALEARREAPQPIRTFVKKASEISQNLLFISYFQVFLVLIGTLAAITREGLGGNVMFGLAAIGLVAETVLPVGMLSQIRTLLKSGYTRDDLVASWNRELQFDQDDRALEHGRTAGLVERASRWAVPIGWGCIIAATALGGPFHDAAIWLGGLGWSSAFLGGVLSLWRYDGRTALSRRLIGKFVNSRLGRWAFRMAGLGLDRSALVSLATDRPTELAIGMAVDSLFDALPKATRLHLAELPSVVRHLEADAMKIRQRVEQLNDVATKVGAVMRNTPGRSATGGVIAPRDALDRDLDAARDAAKQRLADAVTVLETIRLDLLRLTAGAVSVDSLTTDLAEARTVSEEVDRLLDARDEVEAHLSGRTMP